MRPALLRRTAIILGLLISVLLPKLGQRALAAGTLEHGQHQPPLQIVLDESVFYLPLLLGPPLLGDPGSPPIQNAPACPGHDPRTYHGLWDSGRGCHYDHHHGNDPHAVDDIFGTAYYGWAGGSISYPWQTFNSQTGCQENDCKHKGYFWLVRRDQPCFSEYGTGCVVHFRTLVHAMPHTQDTTVRYHSAWLEAFVCDEANPSRCGILRSGGWQDSGDLLVDSQIILDYPNNVNRFKLHYDQTGNPHFGTWYSGSPGSQAGEGGLWQVVVELGDMWTRTPADDPHQAHYFCANPSVGCQFNGSRIQPHLIGVAIPPRYRPTLDPDRDGLATFNGYADRWGTIVSGCAAVGLDCVPVVLERVPMAPEYQGRFDYQEYDIFFNGRTSGWIQPPD
jgi:hypothetical protein